MADYPLLESKITAPALPRWAISRPRLTERIARGATGPVTLVTGPPGAGKTTALASWAAAAGPGRVAWVTLDDYDNRPGSFWAMSPRRWTTPESPFRVAPPATVVPCSAWRRSWPSGRCRWCWSWMTCT